MKYGVESLIEDFQRTTPKLDNFYEGVIVLILYHYDILCQYKSSSEASSMIMRIARNLSNLYNHLTGFKLARACKNVKLDWLSSNLDDSVLLESCITHTDSRRQGRLLYDTFSYAKSYPEASRIINQSLSLITKMKDNNDDIDDDMLAEYISFDVEHFNDQQVSPVIMETVHSIIVEWMADFKLSNRPPRHSSGSTAWGKGLRVKERSLLSIPYACLRPFFTDGLDVRSWLPKEARLINSNVRLVSKTITVPKSVDKRRVISMEPPFLMFLQQKLKDDLYDYLPRRLKGHIDFGDQRPNQRYARQGSIDGTFCTVDMSSASDSLGKEMIFSLFLDTPINKYLRVLRSTHTLIWGRELELKKWAPMGSALSFPIETLVFAACVEAAIRLQDGYTHRVEWVVYGDDIVMPTRYFTSLHTVLTAFGFIVNVNKTFADGPYRESCGKEYSNGCDITPLYYRPPVRSDAEGYKTYKCKLAEYYIDLANNAYSRGFKSIRCYAIRQLQALRFYPGYGQAAPGVYALTADGCAFFDADSQQYYTEINTISAKKRRVRLNGEELLRVWLRQAELRGSNQSFLDRLLQPLVVSTEVTGELTVGKSLRREAPSPSAWNEYGFLC